MKETIIPIFYACDDAFVKYTVVSMHSLIKNASRDHKYVIHILYTEISDEMQAVVNKMADECFEIRFVDVTAYLQSISEKLPLRDYYSKTTYYRLFIAEMFQDYSKAIYIDSDTVVNGDISKVYLTDIKDAYLGACHEQAMVQRDEFGTYVEKVVGVSRYNFFNAGLMLINCEQFRLHFVLDKFIDYLHYYNFVVTQDEDYLNLICKDHVFWLDQRWNTEVFGTLPYPIEQAEMIHYIMTNKPWHYSDCRYGEYFWKYAKETAVYDELLGVLDSYSDEEKQRDAKSGDNLLALAVAEINREDNFLNRLNRDKRAKDRVEILYKIEQYEREGRFDEDVENDPPGRVLMPDEIEYVRKTKAEKLKTKFAFKMAHKFVDELIADKKLIIKEIIGVENFHALESGAIITCNHFNAFDSFAIQLAYEAAQQPQRSFWRVIREGNYTSFPGFYGFLMRHCNTLPLSSNIDTMKKFFNAVDELVKNGDYVLFYPEQSMWWNYRKPKPLKRGAFLYAARSGAPVLPCFITMKDSDVMGEDGFYVQEYTIHISPPIFPKEGLNPRSQAEYMMKKNYEMWKEIYESVYHIPLSYTTQENKEQLRGFVEGIV
ncbi:MAG: 1-acyl-sn-glycerol-3-phosphate acyltransferase [Ruminococcus sp.]|nr:1-acyl-sn-glycerol-3-phosphate acyltransferase [Ruminococcus sp.]MBR7007245.1 1-acyl-sn-glycerol-3-phosphate acyltransferase [Ruminococcus sp.]